MLEQDNLRLTRAVFDAWNAHGWLRQAVRRRLCFGVRYTARALRGREDPRGRLKRDLELRSLLEQIFVILPDCPLGLSGTIFSSCRSKTVSSEYRKSLPFYIFVGRGSLMRLNGVGEMNTIDPRCERVYHS